ncbi:MAG: tRNA guanosine(34) transglycosylase Tgt [Bacteroidales bacterium]|nr:tRNA guanosine(34) transglycosylase Tgt [Bacteroidales bacterium]
MQFTLQYIDTQTKARAGCLKTDHSLIETPVFMPVGTSGSVKGVSQQNLSEDIQAKIILGNTYHLFLRPGLDVIHAAGGLHRFIGWNGSILTDSGGYQVFSLSDIRKITEKGSEFRSHIDGSKCFFSPENVMDTQRILGPDIMMAFDECTPYPAEYSYAKKSMEMTNRWLERCFRRFRETEPLYGYQQSLFPIVQGSVFSDLRKIAAETVSSYGADGNAIGGLSVGEPTEVMYEMVDLVTGILPSDKPRYLMGVGTPVNILENIALGIDMFDCVMPTRNGRNGMLFTKNGFINIKNAKWKDDFSPIEEDGASYVDHQYTKAYLRHLIYSREILGAHIATEHNLAFYTWLTREARKHILDGTFPVWKKEMVVRLSKRL